MYHSTDGLMANIDKFVWWSLLKSLVVIKFYVQFQLENFLVVTAYFCQESRFHNHRATLVEHKSYKYLSLVKHKSYRYLTSIYMTVKYLYDLCSTKVDGLSGFSNAFFPRAKKAFLVLQMFSFTAF